MSRRLLAALIALVAVLATALGVAAIMALSRMPRERRPTGAVPIEFRILADRRHDAEAVAEALAPDGPGETPDGYRWAPIDPRSGIDRDGGAVVRELPDASGTVRQSVLLKLDRHDVTHQDIDALYLTQDERLRPALGFRFSRDGARRFGDLTREHLPEDGGAFSYRLAILVGGTAVSAPVIRSEIRDSGIIEWGGEGPTPGELERLFARMTGLAAPPAN